MVANISGEVSTGTKGEKSEEEIRKKILGKASPSHLIPLLKNLPLILIIEDFHFLNSETKKTVFQQWKSFVDEEITVFVIGTTHHATDLANANNDLVGRVMHIELGVWDKKDLMEIAKKGFSSLKLTIKLSLVSKIANESVGLPILVQNACLQLLVNKDFKAVNGNNLKINFTTEDVFDALFDVANTRYGQFSNTLDRLIRGPR